MADPEIPQRGAENSVRDFLALSGRAKCIFSWAICSGQRKHLNVSSRCSTQVQQKKQLTIIRSRIKQAPSGGSSDEGLDR